MPVNLLLQQATNYITPIITSKFSTVQNVLDQANTFWAGNAPSDPTAEMLYVEKLMRKKENLMWVKGGSGTDRIQGFIDASMTFGASATWDNQVVGADTGDMGTGVMNKAAQAINGVGGSMSGMRMARNSMVTWQNSTFNAINFSAFILASDSVPNPLVEANKVWDYVLPGRHHFVPGVMTAPGGYTMGGWDTQEETVSIFIGDWFEAKNSWVISTASVEVSKERVKGTNFPLWCKVDMVCNPAREFYADEVKGFFKGV